jgi:hypothetical protein
VAVVHVARLAVFLLGCGSLRLVYLITRDLSGSRTQAWAALLLVQGTGAWLLKAPEVRPDALMLLFCLLGLRLLQRYHRRPAAGTLAGVGLAALLAFAGKQNAAVFFLPVGLLFVLHAGGGRRRGLLGLTLVLVAAGAALAWWTPLGAFLDQAMGDLVPGRTKFWPLRELRTLVRVSPVPWLFFAAACWRPPALPPEARIVRAYLYGVAASALLFLFLMNRPWMQEFLGLAVVAGIVGSSALVALLARLTPPGRLIVVGACVALPLAASVYLSLTRPLARSLAPTRAVLARSAPGDVVFDACGQALFRPHPLDPHFLLYMPERFHRFAELRAANVRFLIKDDLYYPRLPDHVRRWCDTEFLPAGGSPYLFRRRPPPPPAPATP